MARPLARELLGSTWAPGGLSTRKLLGLSHVAITRFSCADETLMPVVPTMQLVRSATLAREGFSRDTQRIA
jgi:hypothetical protein